MTHGKIECPNCRAAIQSCRCFSHDVFIAWELCDNCKRVESVQDSIPLKPKFDDHWEVSSGIPDEPLKETPNDTPKK